MGKPHASNKKRLREQVKAKKQLEKQAKRGRTESAGKSPEQKQLERVMKKNQIASQSLQLKQIGNGWFPKLIGGDLKILRRNESVQKGNLLFIPIKSKLRIGRVSFKVFELKKNSTEKRLLVSFSIDTKLKTIKKFENH